MEIVLIGTQEFNWCLPIFARLFEKYCGESVLYIGDTAPAELPDNISFEQVPIYTEGIWPWEHWFGAGLRSICRKFKNEIIALFLLDHWLNEPVNLDSIKELAAYMMQHNIIRGNITNKAVWNGAKVIENFNGLELLYIPPWDIHNGLDGGMTFCPSLWNTNLLDKFIEPAWTLWECEKLGTRRMEERRYIYTVGTRPALLNRTHGLYHGTRKRVSVANLIEEDREIVLRYLPDGYNLTDL